MSQELVPSGQSDNLPAHFQQRSQSALSSSANSGAVLIEQERAIAEAQGQLILAKKFPRNLTAAHAELMEACAVPAFAATAFYSVPNRGSGPSIRFAEEVARVYGNFQYGHRELGRSDGRSEVEVIAWDMEKNNYSKRQITVMHVTDTRNGPKKLTDQADIDNKIANVASKQIRGRILALLPKWLVADAIEKCKATIAGTSDKPISVRVRDMTQAFAKYGVTEKHLAEYLGHSLDTTTLDELVDLTGVFNALREGAKPSEYFSNKEEQAEASATTANKLAETAKAGAARTPRKSAAAPQPTAADQAKPEVAPQQVAQNESKPAENSSNHVEEPQADVTDVPPANATESQPPAEGDDSELF